MRLLVANPQDQEDLRQCRWRDCNRTEDDVCQLPHVRRFFFISERLEAALRRAKPPRENALTATAAKTTCLRLTGSARRRRPNNPAADLKKPRAAKKPVYTLDLDEIARLRAVLDVPSERLLIELAITTGLRSGEIRGLV